MADQTLAKVLNERGILRLLRLNGPQSRADLARALDLTPPSITRLTAQMLARGVLVETDAAARAAREPGRPGVAIALNPAGAFALGVEIGVDGVRLAVLDMGLAIARLTELPMPPDARPDTVVAALGAAVAGLMADPAFAGQITGAVVTVPGLVTKAGHVVNLPILGWRDLDIGRLLAPAIPLPFSVENNSSAAAFGATYLQPDLASDCTLYLKLGHGCGGALVMGGRLFRGGDGTGMEVGHLQTGQHGPRCHCGQVGCLETFVNLEALGRACQAAGFAADGPLAAAVAGSDLPAAQTVVDGLRGHLAAGIASMVNLFNPGVMVLGGLMRPLLARMLPDLQADVAARIIPGTRMPQMVLGPHAAEDCAVGAACIAHAKAHDPVGLDL